jgi:hypothetical protein
MPESSDGCAALQHVRSLKERLPHNTCGQQRTAQQCVYSKSTTPGQQSIYTRHIYAPAHTLRNFAWRRLLNLGHAGAKSLRSFPDWTLLYLAAPCGACSALLCHAAVHFVLCCSTHFVLHSTLVIVLCLTLLT